MPLEPYAITEEKTQLLERALSIHMNQSQACVFAGVKWSTYKWRKANDEAFLARMERAKEFLPMAAKQIVAEEIVNGKNVRLAWSFLRHVERDRYHTYRPSEVRADPSEYFKAYAALMFTDETKTKSDNPSIGMGSTPENLYSADSVGSSTLCQDSLG